MPVLQRLKTRRGVGKEILLRREKDRINSNPALMEEEEDAPGQEKKRARHCAPFFPDVRERRRTVRAPKKRERGVGKGKEVLKEDVERHEFLRIDMGWGIGTRGPKSAMQGPPEIDAPAQIRRIRRDFRLAVLDLERPHRGCALGRVQRGNPTQISARFRRQRNPARRIRLRAINHVEIALEEPGVKADQWNRRNCRREVAEEDLKNTSYLLMSSGGKEFLGS